MDNKLFRSASLDRVNSPEQLNEYIRVTRPSVWIVLGAVVLLLVGVVIWGVLGTIETTVETGVRVQDGVITAFVSPEDAEKLSVGMPAEIDGRVGSVLSVENVPALPPEDAEPSLLYYAGLSGADICCRVQLSCDGLADGIYRATLTAERISPITFVIG